MDLMKKLLGLLTKGQRGELTESEIPKDVADVAALVENHSEFTGEFLSKLHFIGLPVSTQKFVLEGLLAGDTSIDGLKTEPKQKKTEPKQKKNDVKEGTVTPEMFDNLSAEVKGILLGNLKTQVKDRITGAKLPKALESFAVTHWSGLLEAEKFVELEKVDEFLVDLKKSVGDTQNTGGGLTEGQTNGGRSMVSVEWTSGEKALAAFEAMLEGKPHTELEEKGKKIKVPAFNGLRQAYGVITGDTYCEGLPYYARCASRGIRPQGVVESADLRKLDSFNTLMALGISEATHTTLSFPLILSEYVHKAMIKEYRLRPMKWKEIASPTTVTDFKTWRWHQLGEFDNLLEVDEGNAYTDWSGIPSEDDITQTIQKHGGIAAFTWEMVVNDDLGALQGYPTKMARAAHRTLEAAVWLLLTGNAAVYDTVALVHATHANNGTTALSLTELKAMRKQIAAQKDLDSKEGQRIAPRKVFTGPDLYDAAYELLFSDGIPTLTDTNIAAGSGANTLTSHTQPNVLRSKYGLELHQIEDITDVNDYWMTGSPSECDMIKVLFLNGKEEPEIFVQDMEKIGDFFLYERITMKVRHIWKEVVVDYRPFAGRIVA